MQSDEIDILGALTCLLKTLKETDKLSSVPLVEWPTYAAILKNAQKKMALQSTNASSSRSILITGRKKMTSHFCSTKVLGHYDHALLKHYFNLWGIMHRLSVHYLECRC